MPSTFQNDDELRQIDGEVEAAIKKAFLSASQFSKAFDAQAERAVDSGIVDRLMHRDHPEGCEGE